MRIFADDDAQMAKKLNRLSLIKLFFSALIPSTMGLFTVITAIEQQKLSSAQCEQDKQDALFLRQQLTSLDKADFSQATFFQVDFVGASLVACNFSGARRVNQNTDFIGTNLTGSIIPDEPLIRSKLYNSILPNGTWGPILSKNLIIAMLVIFYISFLATAVPGLLSAHQSNDNIVSLNIENADSGQAIPSIMHGVILETNINRGDDGGLYAELIYNRAFQENGRSLDGWLIFGQASANITTDEPLSAALPAQMRFSIYAQSNNISGFR
ncbi:unnamed protein product, partial [Adineta ricciae]